MRTVLRLLAFGFAATASLALAGTATAKTPQLLVSGATATGASAETTVDVKGDKGNAASAAVSIFVPIRYSANLSQPAGTQIGTVVASAQVLEISPDAVIDVTGTILVGDKSSPALQVAAARCTGTAAHAAIWLLHLVASGQTVDVPVFVDSTTGAEAAFSSAKFVLCLPQPYAKALPNYSPNGIKIVEAKAVLSAGVLTNPTSAGSFVWRTLVTPWAVNGTAPNLAGTTESQAIVTIPSSLSLKAKVRTIRRKRHGRTTVTNSVLLSGRLLENLQGVAGANVAFFAGSKSAGSTTTLASGAFAKTNGLRTKTSFRATATVPARETACVSPLPVTAAPGGCVSAMVAGYKIGSNTVAVRPRRR
jgi:hypothetical protein